MAYDGYFQVLCVNGHQCCFDHLTFEYDKGDVEGYKCPHCGEGIKWWKLYDCTNKYLPPTPLELVKKETPCKCPNCSNNHISSWAVYKIPTPEEAEGKMGGHLYNPEKE